MKRIMGIGLFTCATVILFAQADNEIQVYASPTIGKKRTIVELHSNYTLRGPDYLYNPSQAKWVNETLEITHGLGDNMEIGFYTFTGFNPEGGYEYLGNQIRPRVSIPANWGWCVGASLSVEFGFYRPTVKEKYFWQGEVRPIVDKTASNWYFAFNPNIDFALSGDEKGVGFSPQLKTVYTIKQKVGIGFEYYTGLGEFRRILPLRRQEHLAGPMIDLYVHPDWELNTGFLFGLTDYSNQRIFKLLLGKRFSRK